MSDTPAMPYDYQSEGGALLLDAPTYVKRQADDDLYEGLKAGQFCYVLNARQMGKSSLKVRTLQRLRDEGVACAAVDLQGIGTSATEEQWYFGIISRIARSLGLHRQFNLNTWWTEQPRLSYVQRFVEFIESLLLPAVADPIVIFIDEVDLTLNLAFRDDFFGALRESYNRRADELEYRRLTFALFGVTTPSDLIQNKQTTPFNIGRPIDLTGLQLEEAQPLIPGLVAKANNPQALLQAVLDWTGGQPFLTQKLCKLVQSAESAPSDGQEHPWVEQLVQAKVIDNWEAQDIPPHLKTIRDRLLLSGEQRTGRLLGLYQQIVQQGELAADDSPEQVELRLTGLVVRRDSKLRVYNRIYEQVFNRAWLERSLAELRPYGGAIAAWLASEHQDESRLLRGQALQDARTWAEGKSLGDDDRRFLDASQELEKRDIQKKLDLEAEEKRILANANRKANQRLRIGSVVLGLMLMGAITSGFLAKQKIEVADQAEKKTIQYQTRSDEAEQQRQKAEKRRKSAEAQVQQANQNFRVAVQRETIATQQYRVAQAQTAQVRQEAKQARVDQALAKQEATQAQNDTKQARVDQVLAQNAADKAKQQDQLANVRLLAVQSKEEFSNGSGLIALIKALKAANNLLTLRQKNLPTDTGSFEESNTQAETISALGRAVYENREQQNWQDKEVRLRVHFSPNGKEILSDGQNSVIKIRSLDGRKTKIIQTNQDIVNATAFSPDGKTIASAGKNGTLKLWGLDGHELKAFHAGQGIVYSVNFSPDGKTIVSGGQDGSVKLWNIDSGNLETLNTNQGIVYSVNFSPDGKTIMSLGEDSSVKLWNIDRHEVKTLNTNQGIVFSVNFSPDGKTIVSGGQDGSVKLWNIDGHEVKTLNTNQGIIYSVNFSPDGKTMISGGQDGTIKVLDFLEYTEENLYTLRGNQPVRDIEFSPDGKKIVSVEDAGDDGGQIRLWGTENRLHKLEEDNPSVISINFSPDGKKIVTSDEVGRVTLWNRDGKKVKLLSQHGICWDVKFSPNGRIIGAGCSDGVLKLWNVEGQELISLKRGSDRIKSICFSPDSRTILVGGENGIIKLWTLEGRELITFKVHQGSVNKIQISPNGKIVVSSDDNNEVKMWNIDGYKLEALKLPSERLTQDGAGWSLNWSSARMLVSSLSEYVEIWKLDTQKVQKKIKIKTDGWAGFFSNAALSPDGKVIAVGRFRGGVNLWSVDGQKLQTLTARRSLSVSVDFSPNGKAILAASQDGTINLWNLNGQELQTLSLKTITGRGVQVLRGYSISSAKFSSDGETIVVRDIGQHVKLMYWDLHRLMTLGCAEIRDYLTNNPDANESDRQMCGITSKK